MLKGAALKLMCRSPHARIDDSAVVQCRPGDVRTDLKVGWERQDKGKPWLILRYYGAAAGPEENHGGCIR